MCMYRVFYVNIRCLCVWKEDGRIILLLFVILERCINLGDLILTEKNSYCLSLLMACLRNIRTQTNYIQINISNQQMITHMIGDVFPLASFCTFTSENNVTVVLSLQID